MSSMALNHPAGGMTINIESHDHSRLSVVIRNTGERVRFDGDEFEKLQIVEPAGLESEPFFHRAGRPYEDILAVVFQALSELRAEGSRGGRQGHSVAVKKLRMRE